MDNLLGRIKGRPRQSSGSIQDLNERSIPYDKLGPPPPSPLPNKAGISAPNTNPALTATGTEFNKFVPRIRADRDRIYEQNGYNTRRPGSPSTSESTADSSTLYEESLPSGSAKQLPQTPQSSRARMSHLSTTSEVRSPHSQDFGHFSTPSSSRSTVRPTSSVTTRSETSRTSKYAPSMGFSESAAAHTLFYHNRSNHHSEPFHFPRPTSDEEVEILFEEVKRNRNLGNLDNLSIEQKWHIVFTHEQLRWKEEKDREHQSRRTGDSNLSALIVSDSPEWYIKKFLDKTITPKQASGLHVSLRSNPLDWFQRFMDMQGPSVLAQSLMHISRKGPIR
jgi:cytokinesis protein